MNNKSEGSAETGGEKAAANPQLVIACLEEAIELFELDDEVNTPGTDSWLWKLKSEQALIAYAEAEASNFRQSPSPTEHGPESVQPEKLNNAQKVCQRCGHAYHGYGCKAHFVTSEAGSAGVGICNCPKFVALAESSLSSPPPRGFCIGSRCRGCAQCE